MRTQSSKAGVVGLLQLIESDFDQKEYDEFMAIFSGPGANGKKNPAPVESEYKGMQNSTCGVNLR